MPAAMFVHPRYASTKPDPRPLPWDKGRDIQAFASYIRAALLQQRKGVRTPTHTH